MKYNHLLDPILHIRLIHIMFVANTIVGRFSYSTFPFFIIFINQSTYWFTINNNIELIKKTSLIFLFDNANSANPICDVVSVFMLHNVQNYLIQKKYLLII